MNRSQDWRFRDRNSLCASLQEQHERHGAPLPPGGSCLWARVLSVLLLDFLGQVHVSETLSAIEL